MNIHEHQAKQILKKYGVPVPNGVFGLTVEELIEKVERGEIDANQARVSIDARKWLSAKFYPKMFSDRYKFDVETRDIGKEHLEALKGNMRSEKVIDVTPN